MKREWFLNIFEIDIVVCFKTVGNPCTYSLIDATSWCQMSEPKNDNEPPPKKILRFCSTNPEIVSAFCYT